MRMPQSTSRAEEEVKKHEKKVKDLGLHPKKQKSHLKEHRPDRNRGEVENGRSVSLTADVARQGDQILHRKANNSAKIDSIQNSHGGVDERNNTKGSTAVVSTTSGNRKARKRKRLRRDRKERTRFLNSETAIKEKNEANHELSSNSDTKKIKRRLEHDSSRTGVKSHSSLPVERRNDADSTMAEERSRKKPQRRITPTKVILQVNKKESSEHEINDSKKTIETSDEKKMETCSKKVLIQQNSDQGEEEMVSFSSKNEEEFLLPRISKPEYDSSRRCVKRDSSLSVERENYADSAMAEERSRKEGRRRIKPTKVVSLVNGKESSEHEINDSKETVETRDDKKIETCSKNETSIQQMPDQGEEEMVSFSSKNKEEFLFPRISKPEHDSSRRGRKRVSSLSVERENDADSTMTESRNRKRRQRRRKSAEDVSLVNEKESGEYKINDFNETVETRDDKKMETCSKNEASIQQKPDQGEEELVSFSSNNEEEFLLPRISIWTGKKKLLVLDLNGLLVDVVAGSTHSYRAPIKVNRKSVFKRPFCDEFIDFCFEKFDVGIWSSRTRQNLDQMVDFLFGNKRRVLLFCWDQTKCTQTGFKTRDNKQKPLVLKELSRLWSSSAVPWQPGHFSPSNTLLIDDSPYKALCNPPHTSIFPLPYSYKDPNDNSLGPGGDLRVYLEGLAAAEDVQDYVSRQPFGQQPILPDNPSWGFYSRIIQMMNNRHSCSATQASALLTTSQNS